MGALDHLFNKIKLYIDAAIQRTPTNKYGTLVAVTMTPAPMGRIQLRPGTQVTGWLPFASSHGGNGWGLVNIPKSGVQVMAVPIDGDSNNYCIVGTSWSTVNKVPTGFQPGDIGMVHSNGDYIQITQTGAIASRGEWIHQGDFTIQPNPNATGNAGNLTLTQGSIIVDEGNISVLQGSFSIPQGNITVTAGDVIVQTTSFVTHRHSGVTAGGAQTAAPVVGS